MWILHKKERQICFLLMSYGSSGKTESYGTIEEGGESMSLEAIQKVTEVERRMLEQKAAAEVQARQIVSDAETSGILLLQKVRDESSEQAKIELKAAEERAAGKAAEIQSSVLEESAALRQAAEEHLDEAAEFIIGRVVNQ